MRVFLTKIFLFISFIIGTNILAYFIVTKPILNSPYFESTKNLNINNPYCFVLGDSHSERVKQRFLVPQILNLGYDSDSFGDMYIKLDFVQRQVGTISKVIIPADYHLFSYYRSLNNNKRRSVRLSTLESYRWVYGHINLFQYIKNKYLLPYLPLIDSRNNKLILLASFSRIKSFITGQDSKEDIRKWSDVEEANKAKKRKSRFKKHFNQDISHIEIESLKKLVNYCRKESIEIVAIRYPLEKEYKNQIPEYHKEFVDSIFHSLELKIDDQSSKYIEDKYFADQDHLSLIGAKDFGTYMANTYKE